mgnify:CR=1 FL=1
MSEPDCVENEDRFVMDSTVQESLVSKHTIDIRDTILSINNRNTSDTLLILNQVINIPFDLFKYLWDARPVRVCADGAANKLYEFISSESGAELSDYIPDYVVGDLDSITDDIRSYYTSKGCKIIQQHSQYATDFTKCLKVIRLHNQCASFTAQLDENQPNYGVDSEKGLLEMCESCHLVSDSINVLALGAIGGRFDQTINAITELYNAHRRANEGISLYFLTDTDIILLIPNDGTSVVYGSDDSFRDTLIGNCGLLPMGNEVMLRQTYGLKWDVSNWKSSIESGIVSSNNRFAATDQCYMDSDRDFVLNIEYFPEKVAPYLAHDR